MTSSLLDVHKAGGDQAMMDALQASAIAYEKEARLRREVNAATHVQEILGEKMVTGGANAVLTDTMAKSTSVAQSLQSMGFADGQVDAAMQRHSTVEACVEWILNNC